MKINGIRSIVVLFTRLPELGRRVTSSGSYVAQIDGLRFVAVLIVVWFHAALRPINHFGIQESLFARLQPNGSAGVELFFFISGMIIAFPFLSGKRPSLFRFYRRRLFRLEPPYLLTLLICLGVLASGFQPTGAVQFDAQRVSLWNSFLLSCIYQHGNVLGTAPRLNPPLWSLEVEIIFYLIAPLLFHQYLRLGNRARRIGFGISFVAASIVLQSWLTSEDARWYFSFPAHMYGFALGVVACDWSLGIDRFFMARSRTYDLVFAMSLLVFLVSGSVQEFMSGLPTKSLLLSIRALSIWLLFIGAAWGPLARACLGNRWISLLGGGLLFDLLGARTCYHWYIRTPVSNERKII
jgi:peptidoglycan/LPS O-acetylase OafA/YrhL